MAKLLANLIFEPKGKHDPTQAYTIKDTVMSADGSQVYFALQDVPVGVELTDTAYWKLQIDLSATKSDMESATAAANAAAETANAAAANVKADVDRLSEDIADLDKVLNVAHQRKTNVTTTGAFARAIAFSGLALSAGHRYVFATKPIGEIAVTYYLYFVDKTGMETVVDTKENDGSIIYVYTPSENMENVSIKVAAGAGGQKFECLWYEDVGENEIEKTKNKVNDLFDGASVVALDALNGYFITGADGYDGVISNSSDSCATSYIPVNPKDKIRIDNLYLSSFRSVCAYDKDRHFVCVIVSGRPDTTYYDFTVPDNCYYIRATGKNGIAPTVTFLSIPNYIDEITVDNPVATITNGAYITKYTGWEGEESADTDSAVTDYIAIRPGSIVSLEGVYTSGNRCACAYDKNKKFVAVLVSSIPEESFTTNVKIPDTARYIRITSRKDVVPTIKYVNSIIDGVNIKPQYVDSALFDNASLNPVLTFIDDDTGEADYVARMKNLCDTNGVKTSFACLTQRLENDPSLVNMLLSYERQGFPVITHGYIQGTFYRPESENRDITLCEDDLVHSLHDLHKHGFADYKIWCTPYGVSDTDIRNLCKKWGFDALITSGRVGEIENPYELSTDKRFSIARNSLDSADDVAMIKAAIDAAVVCNGWVIVSTHSSYPAYHTGENDAAFAEIVNYAKSKNVEIKTVNEELRKRMPIYRYYEQF